MSLTKIRVEDISLFNYIKYEVLGFSFIEQLTNQPVSYDSVTGLYRPDYTDLEPSPISVGRGWVPFDEISGSIDTSSEQTNRVSVVGASSYDVNYFLGGLNNVNTTPTTVSYYWNYVSVIDGWPGLDPPPLPIVAVDISRSSKLGLQLGGGHISVREVDLFVFATNSAERDDITEILFDALFEKSTMLVDYTRGDYLDSDGYFDSSFTVQEYPTSPKLFFDSITTRTINNPADWTDLNRHRSVVSFNLTSYVG